MVMRDCFYTFIIIILCTSVNINSRISASSTRNDTLFCTPHENIGESWKTQKDRTFQMHGLSFSMAIPHKDCATDASSNFSSDETKSGVNT